MNELFTAFITTVGLLMLMYDNTSSSVSNSYVTLDFLFIFIAINKVIEQNFPHQFRKHVSI